MALAMPWALTLALAAGALAAPATKESPSAEDARLIRDTGVMLEGGRSTLVYPGPDGRLAYGKDEDGNRVCDFSYAGYRGGGVAIPDVPVALTLEPGEGDDTQRIQDALNRLGEMPVGANGFRGALLLKKGKYTVTRTLEIRKGGIVLRGEGPGFGGTWIYHRVLDPIPDPTPAQYVHYPQPEKGILPTLHTYGGRVETRKIADITTPLVPAGMDRFTVSDVSGLKPGDEVVVVVRHTGKWVGALGLTKHWKPETFALRIAREVKAVDAGTKSLILNVPVTSRIDAANGYAAGEVHAVVRDDRLVNVGIEGILFLSGYDRSRRGKGGYFNDENHPSQIIRLYNVRDAWMRRCVGFFYSYGAIRAGDASRVTVEDCAMLDGVSQDTPVNHAGARKYYFDMSGSQILVQRCYARYARHAFTGNSPTGDVVFLDCYSERDHLPSEWHQQWGHGHLFDNLFSHAPISILGVSNYPHGQRAAFAAIWNCFAHNRRVWEQDIRVNRLRGVFANYAIGNLRRGSGKIGLYDGDGSLGEVGIIESDGRFVDPRSLTLAQLRDRLGEDAVRAVATARQIEGTRGAVWLDLIAKYSYLPEWADPDAAPWPGLEAWVPAFDGPASGR